MFELLGFPLGTLVLLLASILLGGILAVWTKRALRHEPLFAEHMARIGFVLLPLSALYLLLCLAVLPGESIFGELSVPLANGHFVATQQGQASCAYIVKPSPRLFHDSDDDEIIANCLNSFAFTGPYLAASLSQSDLEPEQYNHSMLYLLFDPHSGATAWFPTVQALELAAGAPVHLLPTPAFSDAQPHRLQQKLRDRILMFGPPSLGLLFFIGYALRRAFASSHPQAHLY